MSRARVPEEVREIFLRHMREMARYWATLPDDRTTQERLDGMAFSVLDMFDGATMDLPAMDIVLRPHEDDKQYAIDNGEDWFEDGQVINDCMLHEAYYQTPNT